MTNPNLLALLGCLQMNSPYLNQKLRGGERALKALLFTNAAVTR